MQRLCYILALASAAALVLAAACHVLAWAGIALLSAAAGLYLAMLILALPTVICCYWLVRGYPKAQRKSAAYRGCPNWMKRVTKGLGYYALAMFPVLPALHLFGSAIGFTDPGDVLNVLLLTVVPMVGFATIGSAFYSAGTILAEKARLDEGHDGDGMSDNGTI